MRRISDGDSEADANTHLFKESHTVSISFDNALGIHAQALAWRSKRAEVIAANLANVDTPNYLARDMDFQSALASAQGSDYLKVTYPAHLQTYGSNPGELLYRLPTQPAIDGNTVEEEQEKAAFASNALHYEASLRLLSGRIQELLSAIRGE
jgi:flagellar basal-body rod protein FlgB